MVPLQNWEEVIEYYFPEYKPAQEILRVEKEKAFHSYEVNLWKIVEKTDLLC